MKADVATDERKGFNWMTLLHEQTHLKLHERWQQESNVTKWVKGHAFISLIYLTSVVFHPGPRHREAKHGFDRLKQRSKFVYLCMYACVSKGLLGLRGQPMYAKYSLCHINAATQGNVTCLRIAALLCVQNKKKLEELELNRIIKDSIAYTNKIKL